MKWYFKVGNVLGVVAIALAITGCESWNAINELVDTEKLWAGRVLVKDTLTLRGAGTIDRVATDRVIVALGLVRVGSNGTSAAISRCGVTAIGTAL